MGADQRGKLPSHVAIIMDGNGRWAADRNLPRIAGHRAGVDAVRRVVEDCARLGITYLTLFAFSTENWQRPKTEITALWQALGTLAKLGGFSFSSKGRSPVFVPGVLRRTQ